MEVLVALGVLAAVAAFLLIGLPFLAGFVQEGRRSDPVTTPASGPSRRPELILEIVDVRSPVARGAMGRITVQTLPGARCTIRIRTGRGRRSRSRGLGPISADDEGRAAWEWRIGSATALGRWPVEILAAARGQTAVAETRVEVVAASPRRRASSSPS